MKKKNLLKCLAITSMLALSVGAVTSCSTQGSQGPKGDQGDKGETGDKGSQGEKGETGAQGEKGETGATGEQGPKGDTGDQGPKGDTGDQGPKGDTGDAGKDGDTYYPVVIAIADTTGGKIVSDKTNGKAGDSYTLTFTPTTEGNIVTHLYINYEEVSLDEHPEILEGTYNGVFSESVIVSATFGTINSYGYSILEEYYNGLVDGDAQLVVRDSSATALAADKQGSYYNSTVSKEVTTQRGKVDTAVKNFKKETTAAQKIADIKKVVADGKTSIKSKYDAAITAAKKAAKEVAEKLYEGGNTNFKDEDKAAMKAECLAAIEASTTLQEITDVIDNKESLAVKGKYVVTEELRNEAFKEVSDALNGINPTDQGIFNGENEAGLGELEEALKPYGISIDELPSEIVADYNEEISAAKSFEVYEEDADEDSDETYTEGETVLGYEGAKKVKAAYVGLKTKLKNAILDSYKDEINNSKVLLTNDSRTALIGTVDTAIGDWISKNDANLLTTPLIKYTTSDYVAIGNSGLIGYIEQKLTENKTYYTDSFKNERLSKALNDVYTAWSNEIKAIEAKDSNYVNLVKVTTKDGKNTFYGSYTVKASSGTVLSVANPFLSGTDVKKQTTTGSDKVENSSNTVTAATADITLNSTYTGLSVSDTTVINSNKITTYSVYKLLSALITVGDDGSIKPASTLLDSPTTLNECKDVATIKKIGATYTDIFEDVYRGAMSKFCTSVYDEIDELMTNDSTQATTDGSKNDGYIGLSAQVTNQKLFDSLLDQKVEGGVSSVDTTKYTVSKLANAALTVKDKATNLLILDNAVNAWVKGKNDKGILDTTGKVLSTDTLMWKKTLDLSSTESTIYKVLHGSLSKEADIKAAVSGLDDIYEVGVAEYAAECKTFVDSLYTSLHQEAATMQVAKNLENVYNQLMKVYGYDASSNTSSYMGSVATTFNLKSYDSVDAFYKYFAILLKGYSKDTTWSYSDAGVTDQSKLMIGESPITANTSLDDYGWCAFLAALADQGVDVKGYFYKYNSETTYECYTDAAEAKTALKNYLTISNGMN